MVEIKFLFTIDISLLYRIWLPLFGVTGYTAGGILSGRKRLKVIRVFTIFRRNKISGTDNTILYMEDKLPGGGLWLGQIRAWNQSRP